jgi:hypothetical protein
VFEHTASLLDRLSGVVKSSNGWEAHCPCRDDDQNPSLSVHEKDDGQILLFCHRNGGCDAEQVCKSLNIPLTDLRPATPRSADSPVEYPKQEPAKLKFVEAYDFLDADGKLLFQKIRYIDESTGRKTFRQRRPDGKGGWDYKLADTPKILYNLPAIVKAKANGDSIFLVEGEKDANTLTRLGAVATTMPGGAGKWLDIHTQALAGATVDIIADNDKPGLAHAAMVFDALKSAGSDVCIWVCPNAKDISDHVSQGGTTDQLVEVTRESLDGEVSIEDLTHTAEPVEEAPLTVAQQLITKIRSLLDDGKKPAEMLVNRIRLLTTASTDSPEVDMGRLVTWGDFVDEEESTDYDWVIPGLLERRERVIVVAAEGVGKTMLARQMAILPALGVHPFTFQRIPRIRTLTVDLENPERIIRRASKSIVGAARSMAYERSLDAHLLMKPDGMNLLAAEDRLLLEERVDEVKPDLLVLGPLYKSYIDSGTRSSEAIAVDVAKFLDTIRTSYGCSLWLEHHAPLGTSMSSRDMRPFGSAVWSRWPEFGITLQPDPTSVGEYLYNVGRFRGDRDIRQWPSVMKRGKKFPFETVEF